MAGPKSRSIFNPPRDAVEESRLDALADADIEAGRFVAHDDVVKWLQSWGTSDKLPRPQPKR
ncbi:MAG: CopG family transcriptional regulator [Acetobacteraceae bacterium]|nr:CopG family transcriptional regulator [Acetobacteraceae bacterium]